MFTFPKNIFFLLVSSEEARFVQDRIAGVEKHFAELCTIFAAFTRKSARFVNWICYLCKFLTCVKRSIRNLLIAGKTCTGINLTGAFIFFFFFRLRDKNDELSKVIQTYAESENINRSLSNGLINFSTTLSVIGDYRDAEVHRLDSKVVSPLSQYGIICKHVREDVAKTFSARDREISRRSQLDKVRGRNPRNRQLIVSFLWEDLQCYFWENLGALVTEIFGLRGWFFSV